MQNLMIEATKYTPAVAFDAGANLLKMEGKSTPENTFEFFEPIKKWLSDFTAEPKEFTMVFNVPYFNSSSSRAIYDVFDLLNEARGNGSSVRVRWEYAANNENGEESGQEFQEDFADLDIALIVLEE